MSIGHDHWLEARVRVKEWILRRTPPLHWCVQWWEELSTCLALNWDRDTALIEFNQDQRQRCTA